MKRRAAFKPPKVKTPPDLVEILWVDAQSEVMHDGPSAEAGGLVELPAVGYHVRNGRGPHGTFIVLAREFTVIDGVLHSRDHFSCPTGWIRSWAVFGTRVPVYPEPAVKGPCFRAEDNIHPDVQSMRVRGSNAPEKSEAGPLG